MLWTASFQLGLTGARAQNPSIVFKVTRHELELVPILPQQMVETSVLASHRKIKIVPHRQMDALVRKSSSIRRSISFHSDENRLNRYYFNTKLKRFLVKFGTSKDKKYITIFTNSTGSCYVFES